MLVIHVNIFSYISKFRYTRVYNRKRIVSYIMRYIYNTYTYNFANLSIGEQLYYYMVDVRCRMHFVYLYVAKTRDTDSTAGDCLYTCSRVYNI